MPIYVEKFYRSSDEPGDSKWSTVYEIVEQPRRYRLAYKSLSWFGIKFDKVIHLLEPLAHKLHKRRCNGDCGTSVYVRDDGTEEDPRQECIYLGLCADIDLKVYSLSRKSAKTLGRSNGVQTMK